MNKAKPNDVIGDFVTRTNRALLDWEINNNLILEHADVEDKLRIRRRLATDSFLALMISWEAFLSAWLVAAINREPQTAIATLSEKMKNHATGNALGQLRIPVSALSQTLLTTTHFNLDDIRTILDEKGRNVNVYGAADFHTKADAWLAGGYQSAVKAINNHTYSPAQVGRLVRNVFAHESTSALAEANALARNNSVMIDFRVTNKRNLAVANWRTYTAQTPTGAAGPRVKLFHQSLVDIATKLIVP